MKLPITGGCICGAVRYECNAKPLIMVKCHCRDCQQISGGAYIPAVIVPFKAFKITKGELSHYPTPSMRGGHNLRGFCSNCGCRLTGVENPEKGFIGLTASSLDDPSLFKSAMDVFVSDAQEWDVLDPDSPRHSQYAS